MPSWKGYYQFSKTNNMSKLYTNAPFDKSYHHLRPLGVLAVAVYGYVERFYASGKPCFASREHIAKELYSSPGSVARAVNKLVKEGYLKRCYRGKIRVLEPITIPITVIAHPDHSDRASRSI